MPSVSTPPTLEQLRALLSAVRHASARREGDGNRTAFSFEVSNEILEELGVSFYADAGTLVSSLLEAIERLCYIDTTLGDYRDVDRKGTTAADCQAFIANELKNVPPTHDLQSNLQRRMFNATLQKLVELGVWRAAVDAKRFQNQRETERKRREDLKRQQEEMLRAQARARQEEARAQRERTRQENAFRGFSGFENAPPPGFEDLFRQAYRDRFHGEDPYQQHWHGFDFESDPFRNANPGGSSNTNSGNYSNRQQEPPKTKARHKGRAPWYEVLGVPVTADKATIKSAWRRLASQYQPRTSADALDPAKTEKMKEINTAKDEGLKGALS